MSTRVRQRVKDSMSAEGELRYELYLEARKHIQKAIQNAYYLEAIALTESLITDRLESRMGEIHINNHSFKTLGYLISAIQKYEPDEVLFELVTQDLDEWRKQRNKALHEMVKVQVSEIIPWEDRVEIVNKISVDGYKLMQNISKRIQLLRSLQPV